MNTLAINTLPSELIAELLSFQPLENRPIEELAEILTSLQLEVLKKVRKALQDFRSQLMSSKLCLSRIFPLSHATIKNSLLGEAYHFKLYGWNSDPRFICLHWLRKKDHDTVVLNQLSVEEFINDFINDNTIAVYADVFRDQCKICLTIFFMSNDKTVINRTEDLKIGDYYSLCVMYAVQSKRYEIWLRQEKNAAGIKRLTLF